jgi:hypothetical protein
MLNSMQPHGLSIFVTFVHTFHTDSYVHCWHFFLVLRSCVCRILDLYHVLMYVCRLYWFLLPTIFLLVPNSYVCRNHLGWESCQHVGNLSARQPNVGTFGQHPPVVATQNWSRHSIFVSGIADIHPISILVPELHTKNSSVRFVGIIWLLYPFRRYFLAPLNT